MEKLRIYLLPAIAALVYLAYLLFAPREEPAPEEQASPSAPTSTRGRPPAGASGPAEPGKAAPDPG